MAKDYTSQGEISLNDPEVKKEVTVNSVERAITVNSVSRSVAWILKVKKLLQLLSQQRKSQTHASSKMKKLLKDEHGMQNLSVEDMQEAEKTIICFEQRHYFSHKYTHLENGKNLSSRSTIQQTGSDP